jgi:hypothetical protein
VVGEHLLHATRCLCLLFERFQMLHQQITYGVRQLEF